MNDEIHVPLTEVVGRRTFLKVIGSAGPAIALTACAVPPEQILPYVVPPEDEVPGVATWYATVCRECPAGCGTLVRTREGRAVKVEGNPAHPVNRGGLCIRGQASLQGLYNPDRIPAPQRRRTTNAAAGQSILDTISWDEARTTFVDRILALRQAGRSDHIAIVTPSLTGALDRLIESRSHAVGTQRRLRYEAFAYEPIRAANRLSFGLDAIPHYDFATPHVLISFGADFLETWLSNVGYARDFAEMRRVRNGRKARFIQIEPRLSMTAASADEWLMAVPGTEGFVALAMVHVILTERRFQGIAPEEADAIFDVVRAYSPEAVAGRTAIPAQKIEELAMLFCDPTTGPGTSLAVGGGTATCDANATAMQVAVNLLNYVSGNIGTTVVFGPDSSVGQTSTYRDMLDLIDAMNGDRVELLILHDVNPLFTLPAAAGFAAALSRVPFVVSLSSFPDETTSRADLILPIHTPLESWGDHEPRAGVRGLMQPVMQPVFDTQHVGDLLLEVARALGEEVSAGVPQATFDAYLRDEWRALQQEVAPESEFQTFWADALRRGGLWQEPEPQAVELNPGVRQIEFEPPPLDPRERDERPFVLIPYPSLHHYDGRGANKPWLQEIPDPMMKASWDSWAEMHPETCRRINAEAGQLVAIESAYGTLEVSILVNEHLRPDVIAIPIGQGHTRYGRYATQRGVNPIALLGAAAEDRSGGVCWVSTRVSATPRAVRRRVATTQTDSRQLGRGIAQAVSVATLSRPDAEPREEHPSMYPDHPHPVHRWGMTIDLDACNGCNACIAACHAENNVPVVGPEQMLRGRSMSWLRLERYFAEGDASPDTRFVPMLCQHCDHAPCESVCPVFATYHTPEGLNAQIYNRCVGTRYCSNNCPYEVRQFNWHEPEFPQPLNLQLNPDVTVRSKGVMEKCTFCVQRIQEGKDRAKDESRSPQDGEIVPACAQTCPSQAIVFGDLNDSTSRVSQLSRDQRGYRVFDTLNTRPAITYLKKVTQSAS